MNNHGVTLLELIIAVVIVVVTTLMLTFLFPTASKAIVVNRQRLTAGHLAQNAMDAQTIIPFDSLNPSPDASFGTLGAGAGHCDCTVDILNMTPTTTVIANVTYTQYLCINLMDESMASYCSTLVNPSLSPSLKHVHVRVTWNTGTSASSTDLDGMVAHL